MTAAEKLIRIIVQHVVVYNLTRGCGFVHAQPFSISLVWSRFRMAGISEHLFPDTYVLYKISVISTLIVFLVLAKKHSADENTCEEKIRSSTVP